MFLGLLKETPGTISDYLFVCLFVTVVQDILLKQDDVLSMINSYIIVNNELEVVIFHWTEVGWQYCSEGTLNRELNHRPRNQLFSCSKQNYWTILHGLNSPFELLAALRPNLSHKWMLDWIVLDFSFQTFHFIMIWCFSSRGEKLWFCILFAFWLIKWTGRKHFICGIFYDLPSSFAASLNCCCIIWIFFDSDSH